VLNEVPSLVNRLSARIIHNHPNSIAMQVLRKRSTAPEPPADAPERFGVLSSEDEDAIEFVPLGTGSALPIAEESMSPNIMNDNSDAPWSESSELRFMFAVDPAETDPDYFELEKNDIVILWLDNEGTVKVPVEIVNLETVNNIPPFSVRYVTNRRDDLLWAVNDLDEPPEEDEEGEGP